jgi:hypothetical protein
MTIEVRQLIVTSRVVEADANNGARPDSAGVDEGKVRRELERVCHSWLDERASEDKER